MTYAWHTSVERRPISASGVSPAPILAPSSPSPGRRLWLWLGLLAFTAACGGDDGAKIGSVEAIDLAVTPGSVSFPATPIGETASRQLSIQHVGDEGTLKLSEIWIEGAEEELSVVGATSGELAPGESLAVQVDYRPMDDMADEAVLLIAHNSALAVSPFPVVLRTGAPVNAIVAFPSVIDFGEVRSGDEETSTLRLLNTGTGTITVDKVATHLHSSPDFRLLTDRADLGLPHALSPDDWLDVVIAYRPEGGDVVDTGMIQVVSSSGQLEATVHLSGTELAPDILASPEAIDFGEVFLDHAASAQVRVENLGRASLTLQRVEVIDDRSGFVSAEDAPAPGTDLAPGDVLDFAVRFEPRAAFLNTGSRLATLRIQSDDPDEPFVEIPLSGSLRMPRVRVLPSPLDLGAVLVDETRAREIFLINNAFDRIAVPIAEVQLVQDGDEFSLAEPAAGSESGVYGPLQQPPEEAALAYSATKALLVSFTNEGGDDGELVSAELRVRYALDDEPEARVLILAERSAEPRCEPRILPDAMSFGVVERGATTRLAGAWWNRGSGDCQLEETYIRDCGGSLELCQGGETPSESFSMVTSALAAGELLPPGEERDFELAFSPPLSGFDATAFVDYTAQLTGSFLDLASGELSWTGGAEPGQTTAPNLFGQSGDACLSVAPDRVDFGDIRIGCAAALEAIHAHNTCVEPLQVTSIALEGCAEEVKLTNLPFLPAVLSNESQMNLKLVTYAPTDVGVDACSLLISTDEAGSARDYVIPLAGRGVLESHVEEHFEQTGSRAVDILFVVDNSGSMTDNQDNLAKNFESVVELAANWESDFQVGVVTTDMTVWGGRGELEGDPPILNADNWELFADNVRVGAGGAGLEMGLAAAEAALSYPLISDTGFPCQNDGACEDPFTCVRGFCGGANRGFLRDEAVLHLVFVSDEDDQSPGTVDYYVDFLKGIKGFGKPGEGMMYAHAVTGIDIEAATPGGPGVSPCAYEKGTRYLEVAAATAGVTVDLCSTDWSAKLEVIGEAIFGLVEDFPLLRVPDPESLVLKVNGLVCEEGWILNAAANAITFDPDGPCMPEHGDEILVDYDVYCYQY